MSNDRNERLPENQADTAPVTENTPVEEVSEVSAEEVPAEQVPVEQVPVEPAPVEEAPAQEAPVNEESRPEQEYSAAEGTDASLLSEFAPKPINIPNVDLEKEKRRQEKRSKNRPKERKKVEARKKKGKKRMSAGQKAAMAMASFVLFLVLSVIMTGFIAVLSVRLAISPYAIHVAVNGMDTGEIAIAGRPSNNEYGVYTPDYEALGVERGSSRAALVDMIRDNAEGNVTVTYAEILSGIRSSGMNQLIENGLKSAADHLLMDKAYVPVTGRDISNVVKDSASLVMNFTGRSLTDSDYSAIAAYFNRDGRLDDISAEKIDATKLREYTKYSKNLLSVYILGAMLLIAIMLIVLLTVLGRRNSSGHIPIGWSFIISGLAVIAGAILFRPAYAVQSPFLQTVLNNYFNFFTTTVIVISGIFTVLGAFIFLVGNAASDRDDD